MVCTATTFRRHSHDRARRLVPDRVECRGEQPLRQQRHRQRRHDREDRRHRHFDDRRQRHADQYRHDRGRFRHAVSRPDLVQPALGQHSHRRHLERPRRLDAGVSRAGRASPTNQANITLDGTGATIAAIERPDVQQRQPQPHRRRQLLDHRRLQQHRQPDARRGQHAHRQRELHAGLVRARSRSASAAAASGNEYGQLAITGSATLAGSVNATTASGFTPTAGDSFPIVTYASETGGSSLSFTGVNSGALSDLPARRRPDQHRRSAPSPARPISSCSRSRSRPTPWSGRTSRSTYQVDNESSNAATGTWTDSVYLSTQPTLNSSSRLARAGAADRRRGQRPVHRRRSPRRCRASCPDNYYVIVLADSLGLVPELNRDQHRAGVDQSRSGHAAHARRSAARSRARSPTARTSITRSPCPPAQDVAISAGVRRAPGRRALRRLPEHPDHEHVPGVLDLADANDPASRHSRHPGRDVLHPVQGDTGSGGGQPFTLSAQSLPLQVTSVSPSQAGNSGTTTLTIQGAEFTAGTTVSLVPHGGGTPIAAIAGDVPGQHDAVRPVQPGRRGAGQLRRRGHRVTPRRRPIRRRSP